MLFYHDFSLPSAFHESFRFVFFKQELHLLELYSDLRPRVFVVALETYLLHHPPDSSKFSLFFGTLFYKFFCALREPFDQIFFRIVCTHRSPRIQHPEPQALCRNFSALIFSRSQPRRYFKQWPDFLSTDQYLFVR